MYTNMYDSIYDFYIIISRSIVIYRFTQAFRLFSREGWMRRFIVAPTYMYDLKKYKVRGSFNFILNLFLFVWSFIDILIKWFHINFLIFFYVFFSDNFFQIFSVITLSHLNSLLLIILFYTRTTTKKSTNNRILVKRVFNVFFFRFLFYRFSGATRLV